MLPADAGTSVEGRTAANNQTVRTVYLIGPDKLIRAMISYPMSTGRNFDEVLRLIDSCQLTAEYKVATPANWSQGEDVIIVPSLSDDDARREISRGLDHGQTLYARRPATRAHMTLRRAVPGG